MIDNASHEALVCNIDNFVAGLETEGWPFEAILDALEDYLDLCNDLIQ